MHQIQEKILKLMEVEDISRLALRSIAQKIEETGSPQKIKHHLDQLVKRGLIIRDMKNNTIRRANAGIDSGTNLVSLPIRGSANCGSATMFAEDYIEGYLKVSKGILGSLFNKINDLFVLVAVGPSMNRAGGLNNVIENGDYVIVDGGDKIPVNGDYVVSVMDGVTNIKKVYKDSQNKQFLLISESTQDFPPIYIHEDDLDSYSIAGKVVKVMKRPDEMAIWQEISGQDVLKDLGPISREADDYYNNPQNFKKYE
jgi:SOS-response transcriptional repressor LexA